MSSTEVPPLLDAVEAAEYLGVSRNTIYIWVREGRLPHFRIGAAVRFDVDDLRRSLRRGLEIAKTAELEDETAEVES